MGTIPSPRKNRYQSQKVDQFYAGRPDWSERSCIGIGSSTAPQLPSMDQRPLRQLVVAGLQVADLFFPGHLEHTPKNMQVKKTEKRVVKKYGRNNLCIHII